MDAVANGDLKQIEESKIDATRDLTRAEKKVDQEKLAATGAIADAKRDAGETSGAVGGGLIGNEINYEKRRRR